MTDEESAALRQQIKAEFLKRGYKAKVRPFVHEDEVDPNDFRIKVILKSRDVDQEKYAAIVKLWKAKRDSRRL